jgi:hypothetical protein
MAIAIQIQQYHHLVFEVTVTRSCFLCQNIQDAMLSISGVIVSGRRIGSLWQCVGLATDFAMLYNTFIVDHAKTPASTLRLHAVGYIVIRNICLPRMLTIFGSLIRML